MRCHLQVKLMKVRNKGVAEEGDEEIGDEERSRGRRLKRREGSRVMWLPSECTDRQRGSGLCLYPLPLLLLPSLLLLSPTDPLLSPFTALTALFTPLSVMLFRSDSTAPLLLFVLLLVTASLESLAAFQMLLTAEGDALSVLTGGNDSEVFPTEFGLSLRETGEGSSTRGSLGEGGIGLVWGAQLGVESP